MWIVENKVQFDVTFILLEWLKNTLFTPTAAF